MFPGVKAVTVSSYIAQFPRQMILDKLARGGVIDPPLLDTVCAAYFHKNRQIEISIKVDIEGPKVAHANFLPSRDWQGLPALAVLAEGDDDFSGAYGMRGLVWQGEGTDGDEELGTASFEGEAERARKGMAAEGGVFLYFVVWKMIG